MLLEKGIDMTLGPADIRRCHWLLEVLDDFRLKKIDCKIVDYDFTQEDFTEKVNLVKNRFIDHAI